MKNSSDTAAAGTAVAPSSRQVQTSAQPAVEVLHKQPSTGGSYTRNPATGDLVKNVPAPVATEKE